MKTLYRILTICLFAAPLHCAFADGPVATTAGSNLTAYNPSNAYNNQWATMSNGRDNAPANSAKVDFGNCNAVVLRCAQPKCGNGGCTDMNIAANIVMGCVQSNETCKQYGNDLINYMSAQLVANSNAKANAQQLQMAQQQQAAQQQQMVEMQSQMQQQMMQMQQQMAEQNAQTQAQLQSALAQQQEQNQAALANITAAAETAAMQKESGLTSYQEDAIARGISTDVLERQKISGQIMTEIENAEVSLKTVKTVMNDAFEYAGCDARGNNCTGPKRMKKFRERASKFMDPYDNVVDKIYDALDTAAFVGGIDLSDIYMMLNNGCQRWMQFMCQKGDIEYLLDEKGGKAAPVSCSINETVRTKLEAECSQKCLTKDSAGHESCDMIKFSECVNAFKRDPRNCRPCTPLKALTDKDQIYQGWVDADYDTTNENTTVVACGDNAITNNSMLGRRAKNKSGTGVRSMEEISTWLAQTEPSAKKTGRDQATVVAEYCSASGHDEILREATLSKTIPTKKAALCVDKLGNATQVQENEECPYINPIYAICDTHAYNNGKTENPEDSAGKADLQEVVALKTTVITQQMYKQYEYLAATLRRLKTQLEKAVLTANLQSAGSKDDSSSSSAGGLAGGSSSTDKQNGIYLPNAQNCSVVYDPYVAYSCLQQNATIIAQEYKDKNAAKQLRETLNSAFLIFDTKAKDVLDSPCAGCVENGKVKDKCSFSKKEDVKSCATAIIWAISTDKEERETRKSGASVLKGLLGGN